LKGFKGVSEGAVAGSVVSQRGDIRETRWRGGSLRSGLRDKIEEVEE